MYIASIATDFRIHTWPTGELLHTYKANAQGFMKSLSWSKDGSWLVLVPSKGSAEVISIRDNLKHLHSIQDIQQPTCAAFQNNTKRNIALGTTTGMVFIYDIKSKTVRKHFPRAPSTVFKVEYCAKDSFLVAACENGEILLYNSITYNLSSSYRVPSSRTVSNVRCHPIKRNLMGGGSQEGIVALWDIHTTKLKYTNQAHHAPVTDLTFSPLRNDLLVTVGLDRKIAFLESNSEDCIMQVFTDKSSTAIDFCPDGVGLAVALQDGSVQTYDTRQMNKPLYMFSAHNGQIKQILFQKTSEINPELSGDKVDSYVEIPPYPIETNRSTRSYDTFGHLLCGDVLPDIPEVTSEISVDEVKDSFLDAIGLQVDSPSVNVNHDGSLGITNGVKKLLSSKPNLLESKTNPLESSQQNLNERVSQKEFVIQPRRSVDSIKPQTSTPKFLQEEAPLANISPVINGNIIIPPQTSATSLNELDIQMIRSIVKEELKQEINSFKQHLKYEFTDVIGHMRRHFLDLQMSVVKEFVQMENHFNKLKEDISADECFGDDMLLQENIRLRHEIQELRNQLSPNNED